MSNTRKNIVENLITKYSSKFDYKNHETAIILAAGHGKRIKSQTSKMLHKIWEKPTVQRVYEACSNGLPKSNSIIVTGIKAEDVIEVIGVRNKSKMVPDMLYKLLYKKLIKRNFLGLFISFPGIWDLLMNKQ